MEGSLSTFMYVAVAILITLTISSIAFVVVSYVGDVFGIISAQEVTIKERFDEVNEIYDGRVLNGIELLNTLKKYRNIDMEYPVVVIFTGCENFTDGDKILYTIKNGDGLNDDVIKDAIEVISVSMEENSGKSIVDKSSQDWDENFHYEDKYNVTVKLDESCYINGINKQAVVINFEKIQPNEGG